MTLTLQNGTSHEYRVSVTIPLSGSDRIMSAHKAAISPFIDELEAKIRGLGLDVTITDSTVKLKAKPAEAASTPATRPTEGQDGARTQHD